MKNTLLRKTLAVSTLIPFLFSSALQTTLAAFQDLTVQTYDHAPGATSVTHNFSFFNEVPFVEGDKIQVDFPPEFGVDEFSAYMEIYTQDGAIQSSSHDSVDSANGVLVRVIDEIDPSKSATTSLFVSAKYIDNPSVSGTYPVNISLLSSTNTVKETGTTMITIGEQLSDFYLNTSSDNTVSASGVSQEIVLMPTTDLLDGQLISLRFPQTMDVSSATVTNLLYSDGWGEDFPTVSDLTTSGSTLTFKVNGIPSSDGKYIYLTVNNLTNPSHWGAHYIEGQTQTALGELINVGSFFYNVPNPADLANDKRRFSFFPTVPLVTGDKIQVVFPPEVQIFPGKTYLSPYSYDLFSNYSSTTIDALNHTATTTVDISSTSSGLNDVDLSINSFLLPTTDGYYPFTVRVLSAANTVKETFTGGNMIAADDLDGINIDNTSSQVRQEVNDVDFIFYNNGSDIPAGQKIRLQFPAGFDVSSGVIQGLAYSGFSGNSQPPMTISGQDVTFTLEEVIPEYTSVSFTLTGLVNPSVWGRHYIDIQLLDASDQLLKNRQTYITISGPSDHTHYDLFLDTPLTSVESAYHFESIYVYSAMDTGWKLVLQFPAGTDLSQVTPADVNVAYGGFTNPDIIINAAQRQVIIEPDAPFTPNDQLDITVSKVINSTQEGNSVIITKVMNPSDLLMEEIASAYELVTPGTMPLVAPFYMNSATPGDSTGYNIRFRSPVRYQDGWTLEVDLDDTMDFSGWIASPDFSISDNNGMNYVGTHEISVDALTNTITFPIKYSYQNTSGREISLNLYSLINPTTAGFKNLVLRLKDPMGNIAGQSTVPYVLNDELGVKLQYSGKGQESRYELDFVPTQDLEHGTKFVVTFPDDVDLSTIYSVQMTGFNNASIDNLQIDTVLNQVSFDVDASSATNPTSQGARIGLIFNRIKNTIRGNATPYTIAVALSDAGNTPLETLEGQFYIEPPATITPAIALLNYDAGESSTYIMTFKPTIGVDSYWKLRLYFPPDTDISGVVESVAGVRVTGGNLETQTVTKNLAERYIEIVVHCESCSGGSGNATINIEVDGVVNATTPGNYEVDLTVIDNSDVEVNEGSAPYTLVAASTNNPPAAPTDLITNTAAEGAMNYTPSPPIMNSTNVVFSALYEDTDTGSATHYDIEIYEGVNLIHWTGKTALPAPIAINERSPYPGNPVLFSGIATSATLLNETEYEWRIRYFDDVNSPGVAGDWSARADFSVDTTPPTLVSSPLAGSTVATNTAFRYEITDAFSNLNPAYFNVTVNGMDIVEDGQCLDAYMPPIGSSPYNRMFASSDLSFIKSDYGALIAAAEDILSCSIVIDPLDPKRAVIEFTLVDPLPAGQLIPVTVTARDLGHNIMTANPNFNTAAPADTTPPVLVSQTPLDGSTTAPLTPAFSYQITDNVAVDISETTITVALNGGTSVTVVSNGTCHVDYTCTLPLLDGADVTFSFAPNTPFTFNDDVEVVIHAEDTSGNDLDVTTDFTVRAKLAVSAPENLFSNNTTAQTGQTSPTDLDTADIRFSAIHKDADAIPANRYRLQVALASNPAFDPLVSSVQDTGAAGIVMASTAADARSPDLNPGFTYADDESYIWRVQFWNDLHETAGTYSGAATFTTAAPPPPGDTTPPVLVSQTPLDGSTTAPLTPGFTYRITDNVAVDVSETTITVAVNGGTAVTILSNGTCHVDYTCGVIPSDGADVTFTFAPNTPFTFNDDVEVVIHAEDTSGNDLDVTTDFTVRAKAVVSAPENLFSNNTSAQVGQTSPTDLDTTDIRFSAIHKDSENIDADRYRLQVTLASNPTFDPLVSPVQDTGAAGTAMTATAHDARSPDLIPVFTYADGESYIWRVQFWNNTYETAGTFSTTAGFTTAAVILPPGDTTPPVVTANSPTELQTNVTLSPNFSYTITDNIEVDISTVRITVGGQVVIDMSSPTQCAANYTCGPLPTLDAPSVTFTFQRNTPFTNSQTVVVRVDANDTATPVANSVLYTTNFTTLAPVVVVPVFGGGGGGGFSDPVVTPPAGGETPGTRPSAETGTDPVLPPVTETITDSCSYFNELVDAGNIKYTDITDRVTNDYANYLLENGIILGRTPTKFGPAELMTRADVLRSLVQARCEKFTLRPVTVKPFPDVAVTHPDATYIDAAKRAEIVSGYKEDGTYRPDRFISRAESLKVVIQEVLGSEIASFDGPTNPFTDVGASEWYVNYVRFAVATKLVEVPANRLFQPNQPMSREEITSLLARALQSREAIIGMVKSGATLHEAIASLGEEPVRGSAEKAPLAPSPRDTVPAAPVIPMPVVETSDIVKEPIQACAYFDAREKTHTYSDLDGSLLGDFAEKLLEYGVVIGKEQNLFSAEDLIRRSEILRIMIQASCEDYVLQPVKEKPFPDVPLNHRDATFVQAAKRAGIVAGYGDGTFKPDNTISKAEILKILLETAMGKYVPRFDGGDEPYADVAEDEWYARYVRYAYGNKLAVTREGTKFEPNQHGNRAFIAQTLLKILELRDVVTGVK